MEPDTADGASMARVRKPGAIQGWILVACAWLAVMATQVIAPVLPTMRAYFDATPAVDVLISFTATMPALFVALLATPFGYLGDRFGHRRVLFGSTLLYGIVGTAPMWLATLPQIVISRALVGVAEAAVMTCSAALIGDYFGGRPRERYFALQTGTAPVIALVVTMLGGALGESSWRASFLVYGFAFALIPLTGLLLWDPVRQPRTAIAPTSFDTGLSLEFRWGRLLWICCVTVLGMSAFLVTAVQTAFVLTERGLPSPALIGLWSTVSMMGNPVGALIFSLLPWRSVPKLALAFGLMSAGHFAMALVLTWQTAVVGATVANLGAGMMLPTLITWALATLPAKQRGRGTGAWMSASFLGQFFSPLSIVGLRHFTTLSGAILVYAMLSAVAALVSVVSALLDKQQVGTSTFRHNGQLR